MGWRSLPITVPFRKQLRMALLLLVLGAFGVQQWAMQAHWHATATAQVSQAPAGSDKGGAPADKDCLWCHVASHGAAAAPPASLRLVAVAEQFFVRLPAGIETEFAAPPAHAWHSRGPPQA